MASAAGCASSPSKRLVEKKSLGLCGIEIGTHQRLPLGDARLHEIYTNEKAGLMVRSIHARSVSLGGRRPGTGGGCGISTSKPLMPRGRWMTNGVNGVSQICGFCMSQGGGARPGS